MATPPWGDPSVPRGVSPRQEGAVWGGAGRGGGRLSLLEMVSAGTLDLEAAAFLWLAMEGGASVIVAAGPRLVGKTTMLMALLDFLPPRYSVVLVRGAREDFSFLSTTSPQGTYLLVPELSDHTPAYLWGPGVVRVFEAMMEGYSLAATMHADTPEEVLGPLAGLGVPPAALERLDLVVNMAFAGPSAEGRRRVTAVSAVLPGPRPALLWRRDPGADALRRVGSAWPRRPLERLGLEPQAARGEVDLRCRLLARWLDEGTVSPEAVRTALQEYYSRQVGAGHGRDRRRQE